MQQCSLCESKSSILFENKLCNHCYCNKCLSKIHIPDCDSMKCLANKCSGTLDINSLEAFFLHKMIQCLSNDLISNTQKKQKQLMKTSFNKIEKPQDQSEDFLMLGDEIEQNKSFRQLFCGKCLFFFKEKYFQKLNCTIHYCCANCVLSNSFNQCNICSDQN